MDIQTLLPGLAIGFGLGFGFSKILDVIVAFTRKG
jgi:hypothetical protein